MVNMKININNNYLKKKNFNTYIDFMIMNIKIVNYSFLMFLIKVQFKIVHKSMSNYC